MEKILVYILLFVAVTVVSCGGKENKNDKYNDSLSVSTKVKGDSTLYGLACEGCTDSVLIFLSFDGGDPDTFDIIGAVKNRKVIGVPETGDWVGVILNDSDRNKADMVIDLDQLKGDWVYLAKPVLDKDVEKGMKAGVVNGEMDSLIKVSMIPREQGFSLKRNNVAEPIGMRFMNKTQEKSLVTYPEIKRYSEWRIFNGKLILSESQIKETGKKAPATAVRNDTAEFIFMLKDSLRLKFGDEQRSYYRK